jgi:hypothetical protein
LIERRRISNTYKNAITHKRNKSISQVLYSRVNVSVYTQNARSGKTARTLHAIRTNVIRTLYETKYADERKTIYDKRNTLNDIRTLKRKQNENVSKP